MDQCRQCHKKLHWDDAKCPHCGIESPHYQDDETTPRREIPAHELPDPFRHLLFRLIFPKFRRVGLFMMAVSMILVWVTTSELQEWAGRYAFGEERIVPAGFVFILVAGLLYALFFGVSMGSISRNKREALLSFAIFANLLAGIASAVYTLMNAKGIMLVLPIWNLVTSLLLGVVFLTSIDSARFVQEAIVDRPVNRFAVGAGYAFILGVFFFCYQGLSLHWSYTLSICITCATHFSGLVELFSSRSGSGG